MRHRMRGRKLGRNASHRKAMFQNMACSLIKSIIESDEPDATKTPGRIVTTLPKAKELRPYIEKLITMARRALPHQERADELNTSAERNSAEWKEWRNSSQWNEWAQAIAPAVALRRRAFSILRDEEAVDVLFRELAERFRDRPGGYTRVLRLATVRLGDGGAQALIEFVGNPETDRPKAGRRSAAAPVVEDEPETQSAEPAGDSAEPTETAEAESTETASEATADAGDSAEESEEKEA